MIEFWEKVKKSIFGHLLPKFGQMRIFPTNLVRSVFSVYSPLTSCTISEKLMNEFWEKVKKVHFWALFPKFGQPRISRKIGLCHFFTLMNLQLHAKYQKKQMNQFWVKCITNVRTDGHGFIGLSVLRTGVQKITFNCDNNQSAVTTSSLFCNISNWWAMTTKSQCSKMVHWQ